MGAACRLHRRRGDPLRFQREGKLELTTATRSQTVATGIPEGFRSLGPRRVAPGGAEVGGYPRADCFRGPFGGGASLLRVQMTRADATPGLHRTFRPFPRRSCHDRLELK